jgi:hypothetical protein
VMRFDIWTYRQPLREVDLTGFKVEATDGSIGKVDEATYDAGASYVVVDTGPWIFGKKVMLPAGSIQSVDVDDMRVFLDRTKDEIKNAPEFDPDHYRESPYRQRLQDYYEPYYRRSA